MSDKNFVSITNADIYKKIIDVERVQGEILDHAKYTNGKIAETIEQLASVKKQSFGCMAAKHPVKFATILFVFLGLVVTELRAPLMNIVKGLF